MECLQKDYEIDPAFLFMTPYLKTEMGTPYLKSGTRITS